MNTLPPPPLPAAILSFDFDGTLHHPADQPPVPPEFFDAIRAIRATHHALWGINTGRSMPHMIEGFVESRFPFLPDWVVAREREIHLPDTHGRWLPHPPWNDRCEKELHRLFKRCRKLLGHIRRQIEQHTGADWIEFEGEPAGVISRTEEEMAWIITLVEPLAADEPLLAWQRNSIYLRFGHRDFHKGSSLSEVARIHRLPPARCFAIGDSHNDLEMLDPTHAGMTACPANAVPEIIAKVQATGGLVTRMTHARGAIEALHHFFPDSARA
jgi:hypothetical protein